MKLRAVPTNGAFFGAYASWCSRRNMRAVPQFLDSSKVSSYVWIETPERLVLGVGLYESPSFLMAEYMVTNPDAPLLERYRAVLLAMDVVNAAAVASGRTLLIHTSSRGLLRIARRKGFVLSGHAVLVRDPWLQVSYAEKEPKAKSAEAPKKARRLGPRKRVKK